MSLFGLPVALLGMVFSRNAILSAGGGMATRALMKRRRSPWEKARGDNIEAVLDRITTYDMARGAGKLLAGWLQYDNPEIDAAQVAKRFQKLLVAMDREDGAPEERARNRFVLSKALFALEGFHLSKGYYEDYQQQARYLIQKNPKWRTISRQDVFKGRPFEPESIIGATHRILLMLSERQPYAYLADVLENAALRDDVDYYARLIALTAPTGESGEAVETQLSEAIYQWFEEFRQFKINQTHQQEAMLNTGIAAATGGLPAMTGMDLLGRVTQSLFRRGRKS